MLNPDGPVVGSLLNGFLLISSRRGLTSVISRKLRTRVQRVAGTDCVLPKSYNVAPEGVQELASLERQWDSPDDLATSLAHDHVAGKAAATAGTYGEWQQETRYPPAVEQVNLNVADAFSE